MKITWASLFDFSNDKGVKDAIKALKALDKAYEEFIKTALRGSKSLKSSNAALVKSLDATEKSVKSLNETQKKEQKEIEETNSSLKMLSATYKAQNKQIGELEKQIKKLSTEKAQVKKKTEDLNNINKEAIKLEATLGKLTGASAKEQANLKLQITEKRKALAADAKEAAGRVTLYQKESARLNDLRNKYKDVALAQGLTSKAAKKLLKELTPLDNKLKGIDASVGQFQRNVGGYGKALVSTGKQFLSAFGIFGGITLFANLITDTFELIKVTERYNKALKQVTGSTQEYENELEFLTKISNKYGLNLNSLTDSYTKFFVATKNTNLEGEETRRIFDSVSKSAAVMALSSEDTEGALKALGQMISKGKVQAEELRGQLGDRLPGAFAIMADALGVSTAKLDDMLKKGELLAVDVLPKFARQLEITFGLDKVNIIDTLQAAQTRLTNSWISFVKALEDGEGSLAKFAKGAIGFTSDFLNGLTNVDLMIRIIGKDLEDISDKDLNKLLDLGLETDSGKEVKEFFEVLKNVPFDEIINNVDKYRDSIVKALVDEGESAKEATRLFNAWIVPKKEAFDAQNIFNAAIEDGILTQDRFNKTIKDATLAFHGNKVINIITGLYTEYQKKLDNTAKAAADAAKAMKELADEEERLSRKTVALLSVQDRLRKDLELNRKVAQKTREDFENIFGESTAMKDGADRLLEIADDALLKLGAKAKKQRELDDANRHLDLKALEEHEEKKAIIQGAAFESSAIIGNQLFENSRIQSENQLKDLQNQKAFELELAGDSALQRAQIEEQFARKEKAIRIQQAKDAKKQALFNIALNTAKAITAALPNIPLSIAVGLIGGVQAAAVISQPLPAFEDGGLVKTDGDIITSEKGSEMYIGKDGKIGFTGNKGAEVMSGMKGSTIIPANITKDIVNKGFDHNEINQESSMKIAQVLIEQRDRQTMILAKTMAKETDILAESFKRTIKNIPQDIFNVSDGDLKKVSRKGQTTHDNWMNKVKG